MIFNHWRNYLLKPIADIFCMSFRCLYDFFLFFLFNHQKMFNRFHSPSIPCCYDDSMKTRWKKNEKKRKRRSNQQSLRILFCIFMWKVQGSVIFQSYKCPVSLLHVENKNKPELYKRRRKIERKEISFEFSTQISAKIPLTTILSLTYARWHIHV